PLMLPPAPINSAAEARATKAMSRVYSIKSWPCSSFHRLRKNVICSLLSFTFGFGFVVCDRVLIARLRLRDPTITAFSVAVSRGGFPFAPDFGRPEYQCDAVVIDDAPFAGFLQRSRKREAGGQ